MRVSSRVFAPLVALALVFASPVQGAPLSFNFEGTITYTDGSLFGVGVGTSLLGSFSYDPTVVPNYAFAKTASYSFGSASSIDASLQGHSISASFLTALVTNDAGSNVEDGVTLSGGYPLFIDGAAFPNGSFGFSLASQPGNTTVLSGTAMPTNYDVSAFDGHSSLNYGWLQRDGSANGTILGFAVNAITVMTPVPEPQSYVLMLAGLGLIGFAARRNNQKAA